MSTAPGWHCNYPQGSPEIIADHDKATTASHSPAFKTIDSGTAYWCGTGTSHGMEAINRFMKSPVLMTSAETRAIALNAGSRLDRIIAVLTDATTGRNHVDRNRITDRFPARTCNAGAPIFPVIKTVVLIREIP